MTPGARYQAAIDLVDQLTQTRMPLDRLFATWARSHRFAGSKDRRAIKEIVFQIMRWKGRLRFAAGAQDGRSLMIAHLGFSGGIDTEALAGFFDGQGYNPPALTDKDLKVFQAASALGPAAFDPLPDWLMSSEIHLPPGVSVEAELTAASHRAPVDIRVNTLKATIEDVAQELATAGIAALPVLPSSLALRIQPNPAEMGFVNLRELDLYKSGKIELQDLSTQIAAALVDARPKMQVLDLCAGAGGKSLALAASMNNQGQIFAADLSKTRLNELRRRAERAGVRNVQVQSISDWSPGGQKEDPDFAAAQGAFDRVVLDVPCSGSGVWRRNPDNKWRLTEAALKDYAVSQAALLTRGAALVRPGGRLIYITCSILKAENIVQIQSFKRSHPEFSVRPIADVWAESPTLKRDALGTIIQPQSDGSLLLTPESANTDGCFVAILERHDGRAV